MPSRKRGGRKAQGLRRGGGVTSKRGTEKKDWVSKHMHLFPPTPRDYGIGRDIQPKRDLGRFVKWPQYIRLQRQRALLKKRLKVPPAIAQFTKTLDKSAATNLFQLLGSYRPETFLQKKARLKAAAELEVKSGTSVDQKAPPVVKFGLSHVTTLVETKKAKLVVIAHDVDPIELVVWLPALCRKMGIPYCIVKGKARLGYVVHQKTACCLALTSVKDSHMNKLSQIQNSCRIMYKDAHTKWGGQKMGTKTLAVLRKRAKANALAARR